MIPADEPEFVKILTALAALKPGKALTTEGLELFWLAMQDWSLDEFRAAAQHLARTVEFMPNPYHFEQLRKASGESAGDAWALVLAKVRAMHPREAVTLGGRIDRVVRAMGGYGHLAMMIADEQPWRAKRFAELWAEQGEADDARVALPAPKNGAIASLAAIKRLNA